MCSLVLGFRPTWQKLPKKRCRAWWFRPVPFNRMLVLASRDSNAPMAEEMKDKLERYWKKTFVRLWGTEFFWFWPNFASPRRSTYPACRACYVARRTWDGKKRCTTLKFKKPIYLKANNPSDLDTLPECARNNIGLNPSGFQEKYAAR